MFNKIHGGGARDRKKLLEKQKKGKARAKQFGRVEIPQEAFIGVLKLTKKLKERWLSGLKRTLGKDLRVSWVRILILSVLQAEKLKTQAWKACLLSKGTVGSNSTLSATNFVVL